ncbi:hypothetical protein ACFFX0_07235 [Citricoccus parietis]|uniref:Uncharacterized protein n=1 Tax=Citricoccus parietis TaxID=592307 RepID=A0ABV5FWF0_9MICC
MLPRIAYSSSSTAGSASPWSDEACGSYPEAGFWPVSAAGSSIIPLAYGRAALIPAT